LSRRCAPHNDEERSREPLKNFFSFTET